MTDLHNVFVEVSKFATKQQEAFWSETAPKIQAILKFLENNDFEPFKVSFSVSREEAHTKYDYKSYQDVDSFSWYVDDDYSTLLTETTSEDVIAQINNLLSIIKSIDGSFALGFGSISISSNSYTLDFQFGLGS